MIEELSINNQTATVSWIGYDLKAELHAIHIRILGVPEIGKMSQGTIIEAINPTNGKWEGAIIEKLSDAGYHLKYNRTGNSAVVSLYFLREGRNNGPKISQITSMTEFKIPDTLRVLPNDSAEERAKKRKKLKHLKQKYKNNLIERDLQSKRGNWKNFNAKSKLKKRGHFMIKKNSKSIFSTPSGFGSRVGVMNSGKGMTDFRDKAKFEFENHPEKKLKTN